MSAGHTHADRSQVRPAWQQKLIGNRRKFFAMGSHGVARRHSERAKADGQLILFPLRLLSMRNTRVPHGAFADRRRKSPTRMLTSTD